MDVKDIICDLIFSLISRINADEKVYVTEVDKLSEEICRELNICEKCGAKLKGERNE